MNKITKILAIAVTGTGLALAGLGILSGKSTELFYKIPHFRLYGQELGNWCWAAGIQMVNNEVTGVRVEQQDIVTEYIRSLLPPGQSTGEITMDTSVLCSEANPDYNLSLSPSGPDFIKRYFENKNYTITKKTFNSNQVYSEEEKLKLWENIKRNILADQPVILNGTTCTNCPGFWTTHTLVSTGFLEYEDQQLLFVQDPWKPFCEGCRYYLSYHHLWKSSEPESARWKVRLSDVYYDINIKKSGLNDLLSEIKGLERSVTSYLLHKASNASKSKKEEIITASEEITERYNSYQLSRSPDSRVTVNQTRNKETGKPESYFVSIEYPDGAVSGLSIAVSDQGSPFFVETGEQTDATSKNCRIKRSAPVDNKNDNF